MTNLVRLSTTPNLDYDWHRVSDPMDRAAAKACVETYGKKFGELLIQADKLITTNTIEMARTIYQLKTTLPHGEFLDVCEFALKQNKDKASSLAFTGKKLLEGTESEVSLSMLSQMEPRAAAKYLRQDDEIKHRYVATFEQTGKAPSLRTFNQTSQRCDVSKPEPTRLTPDEQEVARHGLTDRQDYILGLVSNPNLPLIDTVAKACLWCSNQDRDAFMACVKQMCDLSKSWAEEVIEYATPSPVIEVTSLPVLSDNGEDLSIHYSQLSPEGMRKRRQVLRR